MFTTPPKTKLTFEEYLTYDDGTDRHLARTAQTQAKRLISTYATHRFPRT